jgi:hypothetical protein
LTPLFSGKQQQSAPDALVLREQVVHQVGGSERVTALAMTAAIAKKQLWKIARRNVLRGSRKTKFPSPTNWLPPPFHSSLFCLYLLGYLHKRLVKDAD